MSSARHHRYHPSTVDTTSWTIRCGTRKHRIHLVRGKLVLTHHTKAEIQIAFLRHQLGEIVPPCLALVLAFKQRSPNLTPPLIPESVREALCIARFARRTVDQPAPVLNGFSPTTLSRFFHPISLLLERNKLFRPSPSFEFRVPNLHVLGFAHPILVKQHGRWQIPEEVIPPLRQALPSDHRYTELLTAIHSWITTKNLQ